MNLSEYFENTKGTAVLSTADKDGNVNAALYARPYCIDEETIMFLMNDRLTHSNVVANPKACFLFMEEQTGKSHGYKGTRLYLTMTRETNDPEILASFKSRCPMAKDDGNVGKFAVYFKVDKTLPLSGEW